ncbi:MAG: hypothetical protein ACYSWZ_11190 [Planctomycetota bacterium]
MDEHAVAEFIEKIDSVCGRIVVWAVGIAAYEEELIVEGMGVGVEWADVVFDPSAISFVEESVLGADVDVGRDVGHWLPGADGVVDVEADYGADTGGHVWSADDHEEVLCAGDGSTVEHSIGEGYVVAEYLDRTGAVGSHRPETFDYDVGLVDVFPACV